MYKITQVREVLSSLLKVKATKIELMAEPISPLFVPQNNAGHSWWHGAAEHYDNIGVFSFKAGLIWLEDIKREYSFSRNGEQEHETGETLANYMERKNMHTVDFFVVKYAGKNYGEEAERYEGVTLYKGPDFSAHWEAVEAADVKRWADWLNA